MNPESFSDYRKKVYNPGSPYPSPQESNISYNSVTPSPGNPLKIVFSSKRKPEEDSDILHQDSPVRKRNKMMGPEEIQEFTKSIMEQFKHTQDKANKELTDTLNKNMKKELNGVTTKLDEINKKQEEAAREAKKHKDETDKRLRTLEAKIQELENKPGPSKGRMGGGGKRRELHLDSSGGKKKKR